MRIFIGMGEDFTNCCGCNIMGHKVVVRKK